MERRPSHEHVYKLADTYAETILGFEPTAYARMQPAHSEKKYLKVYQAVTPALVASHLRGSVTIATSLIDANGLARACVLDVDAGGVEALRRLLERAELMGITAFAQTSTTEAHDGGHVWVLFEQPTNPERLRQLGEQLAEGAQVEAEVYPTRKAIRLPLGKHTWTGNRGSLLLQSGEVLDLDNVPIAHGVEAITGLQKNALSLVPAPVRPTAKHTRESSSAPFSRAEGTNPILDYNQRSDLLQIILQAGGRIAEEYGDGRVLVHCPCGNHKRGDTKPSLEIQPARNPSRYGRYVAVGHAPGCAFYTDRGHVVDAFSAFCRLERLSPKEAVKQIGSGGQPRPREHRDTTERPQPAAAADDETGEERPNPIAEAHQLHQELRERAEADTTLPQRARNVLEALMSVAKARTWCRPSIARIAEMLSVSRRSVFRAIADLEKRGYIESETPNGSTTTIRRFLRVTAEAQAEPVVSPVCMLELVPVPMQVVTSEPPPDSSQFQHLVPAEARRLAAEPTKQRRRRHAGTIFDKLDRRNKRRERWQAMDIHQLERERAVLMATAKKSTSQRQQAALHSQVTELEQIIGRRRSTGIRAMIGDATGRPESHEAGASHTLLCPPTIEETRGASQVTVVRPAMNSTEICLAIGSDPEYSLWAHQRFQEMLKAL